MYKNVITSAEDLKKYTSLSPSEMETLKDIIKNHPMRSTQYYLDLIDWDDPNDPIRKMAIPTIEETQMHGDFDTSGEKENTKLQGLQHKYRETALILTTNECAMFCRHCFRKRLVGVAEDEILNKPDKAIAYIREHNEITNVLLSGGDPLLLPTNFMKDMLQRLSDISHLKFVRVGSRTPVVCPDRISKDEELVRIFKDFTAGGKQLYLTTQFNHPREITPASMEAVNALKNNNVIINNQTVLLKTINDDPYVMADLQATLAGIGVTPYYVFQCRPVTRVMDVFQVPLYEACKILDKTTSMLDGLSKRFRFAMSHKTGKIEILGCEDDLIYFKYHQAKDESLYNKIFSKKLDKDAGWLDD